MMHVSEYFLAVVFGNGGHHGAKANKHESQCDTSGICRADKKPCDFAEAAANIAKGTERHKETTNTKRNPLTQQRPNYEAMLKATNINAIARRC